MSTLRFKHLKPRKHDGSDPILYCPECGSQGSANAGDYWDCNPEEAIKCSFDHEPKSMQLVRIKTILEPVSFL